MRRLALVTGGCGGIGAGIARLLAADHDLALSYCSNHERAARVRDQVGCESPESTVRCYPAELRGQESANALVAAVKQEYGRPPAVLVNSFGRLNDRLFLDGGFDQHEEVVIEHLIAVMAVCRAVLRDMYRAGFGRIVNLGSIAARFAKRGQCGYAAAKAGVEGFSRTLALEVAHRGVTVNVVAPGLIETEMSAPFIQRMRERGQAPERVIAAGSLGSPEDVGALVRFLCSDRAGYLTGAVYTVDGGRSLGDCEL